MDQLTRLHLSHVCRMSTTPPTWNLPPPDHLSGNQPVLMSHPRINSCSDQITEHCVRAPFLYICYVIQFYCYYCCVFIVPPPLYSPIDLAAAADYIVAEYDYFVDDRTPTVELPGKHSHF